jgi:hypothetical protein
MPKLTPIEQRRKTAAKTIVKTLSNEFSVIAKPLSSVNIRNIPDAAEPAVRNWLRSHVGRHEVYGSGAMATHSVTARPPQDLDIVIDNPGHAAKALAGILRRKRIKTKVVANPRWKSYVVQVMKNGAWVDAIDIHPIQEHSGKFEFHGESKKPIATRGINIQRASDQLLRKANAVTAITEGRMGAPEKRNFKDTIDFITTSELLLASLELKTKAQQARASQVRSAIKVWRSHLRTIEAAPSKKKIVRKKPVSKTRADTYISKAKSRPAVDLDNLIFEADSVSVRKTQVPRPPPSRNDIGMVESPYSKDFWKIDKPGRRQRKKKKTRGRKKR